MRYLKASITIGVIVFAIVVALFETGMLHRLDHELAIFLGRNGAPVSHRALHYGLAAIFALAIAWTTIEIPRASLKWVIACGAFVQVVTLVWVLNLARFFFSPFACLAAITGSFLLALVYSRTEVGSRKRLLRQVLGDRVSRATFQSLLDAPAPLKLDGERRDVTVVVCEIFNHDELEETLSATDYVALTNSFRRNVTEFLVERGGYLDECDGESVRVLFGAPLSDPRHAANACEAALDLTQRLDDVNRECHAIWGKMFDFRVGLNSGEMTVAAYGSRRLGTYSVAGEPADFARRLCRANLIYGSRVLVGSNTSVLAETAIEVRPMELIQRFESDSREEIYELLGSRHGLSDDALARRDAFWRAVISYRGRLWDEALELFQRARAPGTHDGPVEFYIRRIQQLRAGLPTLDWNSARL